MKKSGIEVLFRKFESEGLRLRNRIAMAPMTRLFASDGIPCEETAAYYRRRAQGGVGLIITEGTYIPHHAASYDDRAPNFHGEAALQRWKTVCEQVQMEGAAIMPQLWHVGLVDKPQVEGLMDAGDAVSGVGPSGIMADGRQICAPMTEADIGSVVAAYAEAAASAKALGFDGIEIHGAHGYLIDQFLWPVTNRRTDAWGGDLGGRARFGAEVVKACRAATGPGFPIVFRFSQWKQQDYEARIWNEPQELEHFLSILVEAGASIFHASTRRFWDPAFAGSDLTLAGWTRKLSGKPTIAVGSVGLDSDFISSMFENKGGSIARLDELLERMTADEFDLVAVGRALISNPDWVELIEAGKFEEMKAYEQQALLELM